MADLMRINSSSLVKSNEEDYDAAEYILKSSQSFKSNDPQHKRKKEETEEDYSSKA
jgi:hypothetical protein